jgi:hypothetical protein
MQGVPWLAKSLNSGPETFFVPDNATCNMEIKLEKSFDGP